MLDLAHTAELNVVYVETIGGIKLLLLKSYTKQHQKKNTSLETFNIQILEYKHKINMKTFNLNEEKNESAMTKRAKDEE